jgi:hypothetical protein
MRKKSGAFAEKRITESVDTRDYIPAIKILLHDNCTLRFLDMWSLTAGVEHHEAQQIGSDAVGEPSGEDRRAPRVLCSVADERRAVDTVKVWTKVEGLALTFEELD